MIEWSGTHEDPITEEQVRRVELEARREVALLAFAGHQQPRAVIDDWNEVAYTCDYCGLWGHTYTPDKMNRYESKLQPEKDGAVFTEKCDLRAIVKKFGYFDIENALSTTPNPYDEPSEMEMRRERERRASRAKKQRTREELEKRKLYQRHWREERRRATTTPESGG